MESELNQITDLKSLKERIKYFNRQSQFTKSLTLIEQYKQENFTKEETDQGTKSKILLRYALVLSKNSRLDLIANQLLPEIEAQINEVEEQEEQNPQVLARLLFVRQFIDYSLMYFDPYRNQKKIKEIHTLNPSDFTITKYFVKIYLLMPKDGFTVELRQAFLALKEAEKVNEEQLVKVHKYSKLNLKILMIKVKHFEMFYRPEQQQSIMSQALRDAGTKNYHTPNVMAILAELNSKKGDQTKAYQYVERAQKIAAEVLDGVTIHKKYINILDIKSQIHVRNKRFTEAVQVLQEEQKMVDQVYGQAETIHSVTPLLKLASVYSEMKGEEYKSEDLLKEYKKKFDALFAKVANKKTFVYPIAVELELMGGYLKVLRLDKIQKIKNDLLQILKEMGLEDSYIRFAIEFMTLQSQQDPAGLQQCIEELEGLSVKVIQDLGYMDSISIVFQGVKANLLASERNFQEAINIAKNAIEKSKEYFEGNEVNEIIIDPYLIAGASYLNMGQFNEATEYLQKAEKIIKELQGELTEKLLDLYVHMVQLMVHQGQIEQGVRYLHAKTELAGKLYGQQSEQYCQHLEDQASFYFECRWLEQAIALLEKLVTLQKQVMGTENNEKIMALYDSLAVANMLSQKYQQALLYSQHMLSIQKSLYGENSEEISIIRNLTRIASIHCGMQKFDDGFRMINDVEKMYKKISVNNPQAKQEYEQFLVDKKILLEQKAKYEAQFHKPIFARIKPDTPMKKAIWITAMATVMGATFIWLKKRN